MEHSHLTDGGAWSASKTEITSARNENLTGPFRDTVDGIFDHLQMRNAHPHCSSCTLYPPSLVEMKRMGSLLIGRRDMEWRVV